MCLYASAFAHIHMCVEFTSMFLQVAIIIFISSLAVLANDSGCTDPIMGASFVSMTGSQGYGVACTSAPTTVITQKMFREHKKRGPFRVSFLDRQGHLSLHRDVLNVTDSLQSVCLSASAVASSSDVAYVEFSLDSQYVVQGMTFGSNSKDSFYHPSGYTVNSKSGPQSPIVNWYASLVNADSGTPWTTLSADATNGPFDTDFSGQTFRIFPKVATATIGGNSFTVQFLGCPVEQTAMVSFRFKASISSITDRFGKFSTFINDLTEQVCVMTRLSSVPELCPQIVYASVVELESSAASVSNSTTQFVPITVPNVEVFFRILPPKLSTCTDCRDAQTIQTNLQTDLATSASPGAALLRAIDTWIEDSEPYLCYQKTCPSSTLCVSGVCVSPSDLAASQAAEDTQISTFGSAAQFDQILNLSPMAVIDGADQTAGQLVFTGVPVAAGAVHTTEANQNTAAPATTSTDDFISRFFIPLIVIASLGGLILILIAWKMWNRSTLTPAGQALTA